MRRARVMFEFKRLLEANMEELAQLLSSEHGKVIADARGDVQRGLEVIEYACGIPSLLFGDTLENLARGVDCETIQQPLGVCVGIGAWNYPIQVAGWKSAPALAMGNTLVVKNVLTVSQSISNEVMLAAIAVPQVITGTESCSIENSTSSSLGGNIEDGAACDFNAAEDLTAIRRTALTDDQLGPDVVGELRARGPCVIQVEAT